MAAQSPRGSVNAGPIGESETEGQGIAAQSQSEAVGQGIDLGRVVVRSTPGHGALAARPLRPEPEVGGQQGMAAWSRGGQGMAAQSPRGAIDAGSLGESEAEGQGTAVQYPLGTGGQVMPKESRLEAGQ